MNHKKNNKILLIVIILLVILILILGIAVVYFSTDIFKGNKELFFKYAMQMVDEDTGIINSKLVNYFEKQQNTPYTTNGSINVTISPEEEQYEILNDMDLTFSGQVDIANSKSEQNISLNYTNEVKFPLIYKQVEDTIGIQTDYIGSKFISTASLGNIISGNAGTQSLDQIQNLQKISFSDEELKHIKDTYLGVINKQLNENNFSKVEESDKEGYKFTLNSEDFKNIVLALLQTLRNDQVLLSKINEYMQEQESGNSITTSDLDKIIESVEQEQTTEGENDSKIEIIVYQQNKETTEIQIKVNDENLITLTKNVTDDELEYNIELQAGLKIVLNIKYKGLQSMQNITENYTLLLEMQENTYQYNYKNNVQFVNNSSIEDFNEDNNLSLDNMSEEQRNTLMQAITERIQMVNARQMEQIGIEEDQNPLQYVIPLNNYNSMYDINNLNMNETEISAFNNKFEMYGGTNIRGTTVRGLLTVIASNNGLDDEEENEENNSSIFPSNIQNENLIEEIHFDGSEYEVNRQNITLIKSSIETESYYRVEFEKDENTGRIYRVVINKK